MALNKKNKNNNSQIQKYTSGRQKGVAIQKHDNQRQKNQKAINKSKANPKQNRKNTKGAATPQGGERAPGRKRHNYLPNIYSAPRKNAFWDHWVEENFKVPDFSWVDYDFNLTSPLDPTPVDYATDDGDPGAGFPDVATLRTTCRELASHLLSHHKRLTKELDLQRNQNTVPKALEGLSLYSSFGFGSAKRIRHPSDMTTPTLDQFFGEITEHVARREGEKLQDFLQVVPPFRDAYRLMRDELQHVFPKGKGDAPLLKRCEAVVPKGRGISSWPAFPVFLKLYLSYIRNVDIGDIPETYNALKTLFNQGTIALGDTQLGEIMLPTVIYLCRALSNFAGNIEASPELLSQFRRQDRNVTDEGTEKVTLVEETANAARESFIKCLTDRSGTAGVNGKPEGKRKGIYLLANLCLKLLFRCGKLRNAEQMFASINAQSPPLDYFPAAQRVTYLYYLGRYLFSNNLFYPAQKALQAAYDQCHRQAFKQKHRILIYLIACNIILSRFPSSQLLTRPEAEGLAERFVPLCRIIMSGDYLALHEHLAVGSPTAEWFQKKGILFQLKDRCEPLVWRSLTRKVFIYGGFQADPTSQNQKGPPPFLHLSKLEVAVGFIEARHARSPLQAATPKQKPLSIQPPPDSDFDGLNGFDVRTVNEPEIQDYFFADRYFDEKGTCHDNAALEPIDRDLDESYTDKLDELNPYDDDGADPEEKSALLREIESILSSLLTQNLLRGYLTHRNPRFAIPGARLRGALPTGFPNIWHTIQERESREGEAVPAWVRPRSLAQDTVVFAGAAGAAGAAGGGRVVNLKGAKPVGVQ